MKMSAFMLYKDVSMLQSKMGSILLTYICSAPSLHLLQRASKASLPTSPQISHTLTCPILQRNIPYHSHTQVRID